MGLAREDGFHLCALRANEDRNIRLHDPGFLQSDAANIATQEFGVIEIDRRNGADVRDEHVRRVISTAQSHFDDQIVRLDL